MHCSWMTFILVWVSMSTPTLCQSAEWGSGLDYFSEMAPNITIQAIDDEPKRNHDWFTSVFSPSSSPALQNEHQPDKCSVYFSTSSRRLKAQKEELNYMQAIQNGNKAVMNNLVQFVGEELGDQSYEDVITENIIGIRDDQKGCQEVVEKAEEDMQQRFEGEALGILTGIKKIRDESKVFEDMLLATADIANRLEISSQALHAAFTKQLKDITKINR